ncbi:SDR family oxidoreductase [Thalassobaculum sp.]|uniref:SDR family NAD(P)-dependent oxidoreductase n=1 Tax=Thalassobaculum sp. TaxID=2022740 RepID=UPI0032EB383D
MRDRTAIVTGAAQGNGAAIAKGLAAAGMKIALADMQKAALEHVRAEIVAAGGTAFTAELDVTDVSAARRFAADVSETLGPASVLVNNAGIIVRSPIDAASYDDDWQRILAVNAGGPQVMVRAFLSQLEETRGCVVNLGSIMSMVAASQVSAYAASKGAVAQLTKALASELAPRGIRVNAILPGVIETPMTEVTRNNPDAIGRFMAHTPMGRVGRPDELVGPVLFLASDAASYVTGALLPVDGGYLAV